MQRLILTLFVALITALPTFGAAASPAADDNGGNRPTAGAEVRLGLHSGAGYGLWRDLGASPLTYPGIELQPALSVAVDLPLWRFHAFSYLTVGAYGWHRNSYNFDSFGGQTAACVEVWRRCLERDRWQLWGGASLDNTGDIRYSRLLGNAGVGVSDFVTLTLAARAEYRLPHWLLHGSLAFSPAALTLRPGYAYIANYDRDLQNPAANTFEQYRWYLVGACGVATDIGIHLLLSNGNRIGVSYLWHHLTSRTATEAPHRFDQASHTLSFSLEFALTPRTADTSSQPLPAQ